MKHDDVSDFLSSFNSNSYNREQIGNNRQMIIKIYEFIMKLNISKESINTIIENLAYQKQDSINIPLYLEILGKSLGFNEQYDLQEIITTVKMVHDIYFKNALSIPLEEYLHDTEENKIKKLFLNRNNKYLMKEFTNEAFDSHLSDLRFAAAIALNRKEYQEFITYIDEYEKYQSTYSPLILYKTYQKVRGELKDSCRLFWDLLFGNEYIVALVKHSVPISEIHKKNVFQSKHYINQGKTLAIQIDLFGDMENKINIFQISSIYHMHLPFFETEEEIIAYIKEKLASNEEVEKEQLPEEINIPIVL